MKKILLLALIVPTIVSAQWWNPFTWGGEDPVGAPITNFQPTILPHQDSLYDIGTSTKAWRQGWFDELCLTADTCKTAWPTGGGGSGGGTWSTTTSQVSGRLINYPNSTTDIVTIGSNATTTGEYWFDPNTLTAFLSGKVGIGTTSPYASLSVVGEIVGAYFTGTTTATSTLAGGLQTNLLRVTSSTASSTFSNGINLTAGCFSINGTCVGSSGSGASTTLLADTNTWTGGNIFADSTTTNATTTSLAVTGTATTTFGGSVSLGHPYFVTTHGIRGDASDGLYITANNYTAVANFGVGNTSNSVFSGAVNVTGNLAVLTGSTFGVADLTSALTLTNSSGTFAEYAGTSCTNQFVRSLSALGVATCATVANTDLANSTISGIALGSNLNSLSNDATLLGTSYNGSASVSDWGIDLSNPNTWTGLQQFQGKASSTLLSVYNGLYVGTTGTTTILGTATSTFGAGVETTYLNVTGTSATSTFARGINLAGGCFAINGTCIGGSGSSASTTLLADSNTFSGLNAFTNSGTTSFTGGIATTRIDTSATSTLAGLRIDSEGLQISTLNCSGLANGGTLTTDASGNVTCADDDSVGGGSASSTLLADYNTWSNRNVFRATTTAYGGLLIGTTTNLILASAGGVPIHVDQTGGITNSLGTIISDTNTINNLFVIAAHGTGAQAGVNAFTSAGTSESPTASPANADFYFMGGRGYTGTAYATSSSAAIRFRSANAQSNTNAGSYISFETTALNDLTRKASMIITEQGNILIGSTTWAFGFPSRLDVTSGVNATVPLFSLRRGIGTATTTEFTVDSTGNTGIGTSSPYAKLSVVGETVSAYFTATTTAISTLPSLTSTNATTTGTFALPVGASPTVSVAGQCAIDTTSGQLKCHTGSAVQVFRAQIDQSFVYATSSWSGTTTVSLGPAAVAETWDSIACFTDTGTVQVSLNDGTNRMNFLNASTTVNKNVLSTNNTFTALEKRYADLGTPASSPKQVSCTVTKSITAD